MQRLELEIEFVRVEAAHLTDAELALEEQQPRELLRGGALVRRRALLPAKGRVGRRPVQARTEEAVWSIGLRLKVLVPDAPDSGST